MDLPFDSGYGDEEGGKINGVVVGPTDPLPLTIRMVDHDLDVEGQLCAELYLGDKRVSRFGVPEEAVEKMERLLSEPRPLVMLVFEEDPGLQARLLALVPRDDLRELINEEEPWKASIPSFEEESEMQMDDVPEGMIAMEPIPLGNIVRFQSDRKFPDSLEHEARDLFLTILSGGGVDKIDRILKNMGL